MIEDGVIHNLGYFEKSYFGSNDQSLWYDNKHLDTNSC